MLAIINMLAEHYHESYAQVIGWSWRLFCARWVQVYQRATRERAKEQARREKEEYEAELRKLRMG